MASNKPLLIEYELEFLETKLQELKEYIEDTPFSTLTDRLVTLGNKTLCTASKESQRKDLTQAIKDYAEILRTVDSMREKEAAKIEVRGKAEIGTMADDFLKRRK